MQPHEIIALIVAVSGLLILVGAVLSMVGMEAGWEGKPRLLKNVEIGLVVVQLLSCLSALTQARAIWQHPVVAEQIQVLPIVTRLLWFWIPLNYYLLVRSRRKDKAE